MNMKRIVLILMIMLLSASSALAADIRFDAEDIEKWDSIYLGEYNRTPIEWLIMDAEKSSMNEDGMFLITRYVLDQVHSSSVKYYPSSGLPAKCDALFNSFNNPEQGIVLSTSAARINEYLYDSKFKIVTDHEVDKEKIFLMSLTEFTKYLQNTSYAPLDFEWYLRSNTVSWQGQMLINEYGSASYTKQNSWYFRPCMNINPAGAVFISPAEGGKESSIGLFPIEKGQNASTWKLTLMDNTREFSASAAAQVYSDDRKLVIDYSSSTISNNEYISAFLLDSEGNILFYGALDKPNKYSGSLEITLPEGLENGSYTLQVFSEQRNDSKHSDYVSAASELSFTLTDRPPVPDAGSPDTSLPEPEIPEIDLPRTGDTTSIMMWLACFAASAAGAAALTARRKKLR
ncbi:MAG: LPXTG cell wall anchor domain-containing protein [Clostridia bacterium]|nr:LPXTG cell wall anchor domain-containing protein [Clostridia bacterium]